MTPTVCFVLVAGTLVFAALTITMKSTDRRATRAERRLTQRDEEIARLNSALVEATAARQDCPAPAYVKPGVTVGVKHQDGHWFVMLVNGSSWAWMGAVQARLVAKQLRDCAEAIDPPEAPAAEIETVAAP